MKKILFLFASTVIAFSMYAQTGTDLNAPVRIGVPSSTGWQRNAPLHVYQTSMVPTTKDSVRRLVTYQGVIQPSPAYSPMENTLWLRRGSTLSNQYDISNISLHDGLAFNNPYVKPGVDTYTWYERNPFASYHAWGHRDTAQVLLKNGKLYVGPIWLKYNDLETFSFPSIGSFEYRLYVGGNTYTDGTVGGHSAKIGTTEGTWLTNLPLYVKHGGNLPSPINSANPIVSYESSVLPSPAYTPMESTLWLRRTSTSGNPYDATNVCFHEGISYNKQNKQPGVDTYTWKERNPFMNTQSWGHRDTTYMTLKNGNLGIGRTNPTNKLEVNGTIRAKEVIVETSGSWADFVFAKDYKLPELKEVEAHIIERGCLPEIPSAEEVAENGVSLSEMNVKLLQKVEELTLYIIEQNKQLTTQNERISTLEKALELK